MIVRLTLLDSNVSCEQFPRSTITSRLTYFSIPVSGKQIWWKIPTTVSLRSVRMTLLRKPSIQFRQQLRRYQRAVDAKSWLWCAEALGEGKLLPCMQRSESFTLREFIVLLFLSLSRNYKTSPIRKLWIELSRTNSTQRLKKTQTRNCDLDYLDTHIGKEKFVLLSMR